MLLPTAEPAAATEATAAAGAAAAPAATPAAAPAAGGGKAGASRCPVVLADSAVAEARRLTGVAVVAVADSGVAVAGAAQQHRDR